LSPWFFWAFEGKIIYSPLLGVGPLACRAGERSSSKEVRLGGDVLRRAVMKPDVSPGLST